MSETLVSSKYQIVIPKKIREKAKLTTGQKLFVYTLGDKIILTPKKDWPGDYLKELKGQLGIQDVLGYLDEQRNLWTKK